MLFSHFNQNVLELHIIMYETLEVEERRNRAQLMETYKYLNNHYKTPPERFFKKNGERTLRETFPKTG